MANPLTEQVRQLARQEQLAQKAREIAVREKIKQLRANAVKNREKNLFEHK